MYLIGMPGGWEWIIILFAILLLFGGKKIPELMRGVGKGIKEFNNAKANIKGEIEEGMKEIEEEETYKKYAPPRTIDWPWPYIFFFIYHKQSEIRIVYNIRLLI